MLADIRIFFHRKNLFLLYLNMLKDKGEECNMRKNCAKYKQIEYVQDEKCSVEEILIQNSQFDVDLSARREKNDSNNSLLYFKMEQRKAGAFRK